MKRFTRQLGWAACVLFENEAARSQSFASGPVHHELRRIFFASASRRDTQGPARAAGAVEQARESRISAPILQRNNCFIGVVLGKIVHDQGL